MGQGQRRNEIEGFGTGSSECDIVMQMMMGDEGGSGFQKLRMGTVSRAKRDIVSKLFFQPVYYPNFCSTTSSSPTSKARCIIAAQSSLTKGRTPQ